MRVPGRVLVDQRGFTGRNRELAELDAIAAGAGMHITAVVISALSDTAGVGKPNPEN